MQLNGSSWWPNSSLQRREEQINFITLNCFISFIKNRLQINEMQIFKSVNVFYLHIMNETGELKQFQHFFKRKVLVMGKTNAGAFYLFVSPDEEPDSGGDYKREQHHSFSRNTADESITTLLFRYLFILSVRVQSSECVFISRREEDPQEPAR